MKIPKIIHQTWKNYNVPSQFRTLAHSWRHFHRDWMFTLWTDDQNRDFIKSHFSDFLPIYNNYPTDIQRVDAIRYLILYKYGGVFIDLDFECLQNVEPILEGHDCVFGREPKEHCDIHNKDTIISNAFMAAIPNADFLNKIIGELYSQSLLYGNYPINDRVLETTGPFMVSRLYSTYPQKDNVCILDPELLYPLPKSELINLEKGNRSLLAAKKIYNAYGIHHYAGTWWKSGNENPKDNIEFSNEVFGDH